MASPRKAKTEEDPGAEATLQGLRTSHYRLSTVLEALVEGVAQYDRGGKLQEANASARRILPEGDLEALEQRSIHEEGSPWPAGAHPVGLALRTGQAATGLVMGIRKPLGGVVWVSLNAMPLLYQSREPWGLVVSLTDISAQRQLQRRTEVVADLLQMAYQAEDLGLLAVAMADRLALWSGCAQVAIHCPDGRLPRAFANHGAKEANLLETGPQEAGPIWANHLAAQARRPGPGQAMLASLARQGWEAAAILPLRLGNATPACLVFLDARAGTLEDLPLPALEEVAGIAATILAKALAEQALRDRADALARSRGQLAQAQALAGLGSWSLDLTTRTQEWSPETYLQWDCDPADPPPAFEALLPKVHPGDQEAFQAFLSRLTTTRYTEELELRLLSPTGAIRHLLLQAIPLTGAGEPAGRFQGACMDITSRKASELALRDLATLSAKGQMAAYIAHEVNNPLAGIRNAFLLLEGAIPAAHPHRSYIPLITREIDRIGSIIRTMYHLYRPEPANARKVVMREVFYDLESLLAPKCRGQEASIAFDQAGMTSEGVVNEGFFRQVLFNLIQNALEASPSGGVVTVTARTKAGWLEVAVGDHGPGVPEAHAGAIFHSGFTTKLDSEMNGLGLGLATCRSLVESMGGTLGYRNREPGPGAVFTVRVPFGNA